MAADRSFARVRWDRSVEVAVTTLDELIAAHGDPAFCKIDVEGFEADVLAGLSRPLRALSFEYLPPAHDAALAVLERVERARRGRGWYEYNYSPVETMRFASDRWLDAAGLVRLLERCPPARPLRRRLRPPRFVIIGSVRGGHIRPLARQAMISAVHSHR